MLWRMSMDAIAAQLNRINTEIVRLQAQREILEQLLGETDTAIQIKPLRSSPPNEGGLARDYAVRPRNPSNTQAILDAVARNPGATITEIADKIASERGLDKKARYAIYNTAYGLARRGKIIKDDEQRVMLPK